MKACVIQPPYSMELGKADEYFEIKMKYMDECDDSMDIIVLPEYSDVPVAAVTKEDNFKFHEMYIERLLNKAKETAIRCRAAVFVNGLCKTETGYRNTTYAFNKNGELAGRYFKQHLPPSETYTLELDSSYIREYKEPYVLEMDGIRYGFLTCYDFYFYEAFARIARQKVDVIIGCSLQRSDTHEALEIMGRFLAYNTNAYLVRASVSLDGSPDICGASMIVAPDGKMLLNMKSDTGLGVADIDPVDGKYYKPAGFGNPPAPHYEYIEWGRRPWQYRNGGCGTVQPDEYMPYPRVCAHRGFNTIAPENSMPAFGAAVAMGAEEIEFDLWYTKDGELVSIHDDTLDRVSDGSGKVYEHTYEELLKLDFGIKHGETFRGMKIITFEDILKKFACRTIMNIHIKTNGDIYDSGTFEKIVTLIDKYDCRRHVYFMISSNDVIKMAKDIAPDIPVCCGELDSVLRHEEDTTIVDRAIELGCRKVQLFKPYFNQEMIDKAHSHGIICNCFFSDDPEEAERLLEMGIDTILTNDYNIVANSVNK